LKLTGTNRSIGLIRIQLIISGALKSAEYQNCSVTEKQKEVRSEALVFKFMSSAILFSATLLLAPKVQKAGGYCEESTDDPISNSTLKVLRADGTLA
jgi:hypothetical protein